LASIQKLPSGNWRVLIRRKGQYVSETFIRRKDAEMWARRVEGAQDFQAMDIDPRPRDVAWGAGSLAMQQRVQPIG
jgi:hypothetical protein